MATHYNLTEFDAAAYDCYVESLRTDEYDSLQTTSYLDHAGTTLYARSLLDAFHHDLSTNLFGNPHSISPASNLATLRVEEARKIVLEYFNADDDSFDIIFTASATAAIKLVSDCFRDQGFDYYYHRDSHSSIVGVRELASKSECLASNKDVEKFIADVDLCANLKLFAYPAQSNMTGYRTPLSWSSQIRKRCKSAFILLDAASYLTSARLDLSNPDESPDFIALSFYKIFGFPTGLGALLVRKASAGVLKQRRYFGGGTVDQVTVIGRQSHAIKDTSLHDRLEDGTLAFHLIASLKHAIDVQKRLFVCAEFISLHCASLVKWLSQSMVILKHGNGNRVVELYKDSEATYGDPTSQGPIIAFSILRNDGTYVGKSQFERLANDCGFQIRTGGVCNPGGIASMLQLQHWELQRNFAEGVRCGDDLDIMGAKPTGTIRVSLGPMSTMSDVKRFAKFLEEFFIDQSTSPNREQKQISGLVMPVRGCTGFYVDSRDYAGFQSWHDQWCIILDGSKEVMQVERGNMQVAIDVEEETLVFDNDFRMSLWDLPNVSGIQTLSVDEERKWDVYDGPINAWLTRKMGVPCSLARYRALDVRQRPELLTCVVSGCNTQCPSADDLRHHYRKHAQEFLDLYPFSPQNQPGSSVDSPADLSGHSLKIDSGTTEMAKSVSSLSAKEMTTFIASVTVKPAIQPLSRERLDENEEPKPVLTTEKKPRRHTMKRIFFRSRA